MQGKFFFSLSLVCAAFLAAPSHAQPANTAEKLPVDAYMATKEKAFSWLLGTWESYYEGTNSFATSRSGGTLIFTLESDGRVVGRIGKTNGFMDEYGYRAGMYVYRGLDLPLTYAPGKSIYTVRTQEGEFLRVWSAQNERNWSPSGVSLHQGDSTLQLDSVANGYLSGGGAKWIKTSGPRIATAKKNGACNDAAYILHLRNKGEALIAAFARETERLAGNDPSTTTRKRYYYVRADFVEDEQDEEIRRWEKLVGEIIANRGPDDFLRNSRNNIIAEYRSATSKYLNEARNSEACPKHTSTSPYTNLLMGKAMADAVEIRMSEVMAEEVAQAQAVQEAYTRRFYNSLGEVGSLEGKLVSASVDAVAAALTADGVKEQEVQALVPLLKVMRDKYSRMEAAGNPPGPLEVQREMKAAFKSAGVKYDPSASTSEILGVSISGSMSVVELFRSMVLGKTLAAKGKLLGPLSIIIDTAEIVKSLSDLKTLFRVNDEDMPVTLAVTEDAAHLEVLHQRYKLFYQAYEKFENDYAAILKEAERRGNN